MNVVKNTQPRNERRRAMFVAVLAFLFPLAFASQAFSAEKADARKFKRGALIHFEGEITPQLEQYLYRKLDVAKDRGVDLVVIEIESPGGNLKESQRIAEHLRDNVNWAYTVAYIPREALSGAAFVALGCDEIVMDPKARLGDAGAIFQNEAFFFQHVEQKVVTDMAEWIRVMAESRGRPPLLAEAMVDRHKIVYEATNVVTGESAELGEELVSSPLIDKVSFTGSVPTGKRIAEAAAKN
ncbi:MAG: aldehyde dehydrogenase family protein, partial [Planctomycetes bacterium]|nr:aldehyde dehydrogenase family protein [Planctomycetota bacterium]